MICKLGLVHGRAKVLFVMPEPRGNCLVVCPLPISNVEECKNTSTAKLPAQTLATCTSFASSENKEAQKLSGSRTKSRNYSKALERCENNFLLYF